MTKDELLEKAKLIANELIPTLNQHSYSIVGPDETYWYSRRYEHTK